MKPQTLEGTRVFSCITHFPENGNNLTETHILQNKVQELGIPNSQGAQHVPVGGEGVGGRREQSK